MEITHETRGKIATDLRSLGAEIVTAVNHVITKVENPDEEPGNGLLNFRDTQAIITALNCAHGKLGKMKKLIDAWNIIGGVK